jgi:hypothetical protein
LAELAIVFVEAVSKLMIYFLRNYEAKNIETTNGSS